MFLDSKGERKVIKNKIIKVQDILITVASEDFDDYICITDMAAAKGGDSRAADVIRNWLRNRMTLNFYVHGKKFIIRNLKCSNLNTLKNRLDY